ncbi:hypothetical protein DGI_1072 [Megalodesulfovibrio gigas DSM 1382 = ATCC 19364]|uniref:Uncharacterized protein n=2 Tax=Megalodesulfovibrio gigas TaxID=879 RepID=T2G9Z1_MEGG1|nr:hypothetical protein DGI_1072 [Megalodesulfovibrio gigas DSM 1382 = ATCC 19364]
MWGVAMRQSDSSSTCGTQDQAEAWLQSREELLSRILERKRSFVDTASKRYLLYLGRWMTRAGAVLAQDNADQVQCAADAFRQAVAGRMESHYLGRLLSVMKAVIEEASRDPGLGFLPGPKAEAIAHTFLDDLADAFAAHLDQSMCALNARPSAESPTGETSGYVVQFRGEMEPRVRRLNVELVELYCRMHRSLKKDYCCVQEEEAPREETVPQLLDAFGRGLLHPVDCCRGIDSCTLASDTNFPRLLCAPVLQALRSYVIGSDKYDATNKKLIQSIYKYCTAQSEFQRSRLTEYFEEPHVKQYLLAYIVHILQVFCEETKLEAFANVVRANLKEVPGTEGIGFRQIHLSMLVHSWARCCLDNLGTLRGRKRVVQILRVHLPGTDIPEVEEEGAAGQAVEAS